MKRRARKWAWMPRLWMQRPSVLLMLPALALIFGLYIIPIGHLAAVSFGEKSASFAAYTQLFGEWSYSVILWRSVRLSAAVTVACALLGYPIGYVLAFSSGRARALMSLLVLLPFWTSVLVRNYAWLYLLRKGGAISLVVGFLLAGGGPVDLLYNEVGVVIAMTNTLLPFMVLPIAVAIQSQDRALREAAGSLGARPASVFWSVTLPLSLTGVYAGSLLVFTTALGFFITPALLGGGRVLVAATFISQQIQEFVDWPLAAAASMILLVIVIALVAAYRRVTASEVLEGSHVVG